jgi:hypothetical protein
MTDGTTEGFRPEITGSLPLRLPTVNNLVNPKELKDISMEKVTNDNFANWKSVVESEFRYYRILPIMDGTQLPPPQTETQQFQYWESTFRLFEMKFARTLPIEVWEAIKDKPSLLDKWTSICANYTKPNLAKVLTALTQIKLESKESVSRFAVRLKHLLDDATRCGQPMTENSRIDWLLSKLDTVFPTETQNLIRAKEVSGVTWDYVE